MPRLGITGVRWLKGAHLLAACCWIGGAISLLTLHILKGEVGDGGVLYGINKSMHHVDIWVIVIPGAFGCLITGLVYSLFTPWGFFRHNWITLKWIVTVAAILFGMFFLGPWETAIMNLSGELGLAALDDPDYRYYEGMNFMFGSIQCLLLIIVLFISVFKPTLRLGRSED